MNAILWHGSKYPTDLSKDLSESSAVKVERMNSWSLLPGDENLWSLSKEYIIASVLWPPKQEQSYRLSYVSSWKRPVSAGQAAWAVREWCWEASAVTEVSGGASNSLRRNLATWLRAEETEGGSNLPGSQRAQNIQGLHFQWWQNLVQVGSSICLSFIHSTKFYFTFHVSGCAKYCTYFDK